MFDREIHENAGRERWHTGCLSAVERKRGKMHNPLGTISMLTMLCLLFVGCAEDRVERDVQALTGDLAPVVEGSSQLAWDLYSEVRTEEGNLFLSPFSISAALSMTSVGARENTADEMSAVLHFDVEDRARHQAFGALIRDLSGDKPGRGYQLYIANRLFARDDKEIGEEFLAILDEEYGAGLERLAFGSDPNGSRQYINEWVAEQTREKIVELIPSGSITPDTALVITNAIYFKAFWAEQFDPSDTHDGLFTRMDGSQVTVPMMSAEIDCNTSRGEGWSLLELDYEDHEVSMVIILPEGDSTLEDVEAQLAADGLSSMLASIYEQELQVRMPRFEFRYAFSVADALTNLGMVDAFNPAAADFGGIAGDVFINDVIHEAYVRVDEEGTEAAAATAVVMLDSASMPFDVDRAFLFVIRDKLTGSLLFLGRVDDPTAS
jgi:serpin B